MRTKAYETVVYLHDDKFLRMGVRSPRTTRSIWLTHHTAFRSSRVRRVLARVSREIDELWRKSGYRDRPDRALIMVSLDELTALWEAYLHQPWIRRKNRKGVRHGT